MHFTIFLPYKDYWASSGTHRWPNDANLHHLLQFSKSAWSCWAPVSQVLHLQFQANILIALYILTHHSLWKRKHYNLPLPLSLHVAVLVSNCFFASPAFVQEIFSCCLFFAILEMYSWYSRQPLPNPNESKQINAIKGF